MVEQVVEKAIIGWRKLAFGLASVAGTVGVEAFVEGGWSKFGFACMVLINALFYGPPVLKELTKLVAAWRGNKTDD